MPQLLGETFVMGLKYNVTLPPPAASDVATRELSITVGEGPTNVVQLPGDALSHEFIVERDVAVAMFLVDVDGSGNRSPQSPTLAFTSRDTIPPAAPGELSAMLIEQTD
jgi:hypothetical protein